jgi:hypothetical protein
MNWNLVGSIYGRFSIKIAHFVLIRYHTWPPQTIIVSDWLISKKIFSYVTAWPNDSRGPSKDASYQVSIPLAMQFQRRIFFRNQPIRYKNCLWWPCLFMDWDEMSNLYRVPSIDLLRHLVDFKYRFWKFYNPTYFSS